jgi:hypothetical protein
VNSCLTNGSEIYFIFHSNYQNGTKTNLGTPFSLSPELGGVICTADCVWQDYTDGHSGGSSRMHTDSGVVIQMISTLY